MKLNTRWYDATIIGLHVIRGANFVPEPVTATASAPFNKPDLFSGRRGRRGCCRRDRGPDLSMGIAANHQSHVSDVDKVEGVGHAVGPHLDVRQWTRTVIESFTRHAPRLCKVIAS